jgi:hypothetical protein
MKLKRRVLREERYVAKQLCHSNIRPDAGLGMAGGSMAALARARLPKDQALGVYLDLADSAWHTPK